MLQVPKVKLLNLLENPDLYNKNSSQLRLFREKMQSQLGAKVSQELPFVEWIGQATFNDQPPDGPVGHDIGIYAFFLDSGNTMCVLADAIKETSKEWSQVVDLCQSLVGHNFRYYGSKIPIDEKVQIPEPFRKTSKSSASVLAQLKIQSLQSLQDERSLEMAKQGLHNIGLTNP